MQGCPTVTKTFDLVFTHNELLELSYALRTVDRMETEGLVYVGDQTRKMTFRRMKRKIEEALNEDND